MMMMMMILHAITNCDGVLHAHIVPSFYKMPQVTDVVKPDSTKLDLA